MNCPNDGCDVMSKLGEHVDECPFRQVKCEYCEAATPLEELKVNIHPKIMKGTEVPNPRRSSACDCTCVLTRTDHCLVNNSIMTFALELIWLRQPGRAR